MPHSRAIGALVLGAAAILIPVVALLHGAPRDLALLAGLTVMAIGFWALAVLPEHLTALLFVLAAVVLEIAPQERVFSGFTTTAFWLVFSGVILGAAVQETGLARRLAGLVARRLAGHDYPALVAAMVLLGGGLAFFLPSTMGRVVLMVPLILALADALGLTAGRPGRAGLVIAFSLSTYVLPATILPANVPNMILAGAVEEQIGLQLSYGTYAALHMPVLGVLKAGLLVVVLPRLFPDRLDLSRPGTAERPEPLSWPARRLIAILVATVLFWALDILHGISPAWIGLAAALACLLPGARVVAADSFRRMNFGPIFYVGGMLGVAALVSDSGLGLWLTSPAIDALAGAPPLVVFFGLAAIAALVGVVATMPAVPAVLTPAIPALARSTGWSEAALAMVLVIGFSTPLFPHQNPPMIVALALTATGLGPATRATLAMAGLSILLLWPLDALWWGLLGWL